MNTSILSFQLTDLRHLFDQRNQSQGSHLSLTDESFPHWGFDWWHRLKEDKRCFVCRLTANGRGWFLGHSVKKKKKLQKRIEARFGPLMSESSLSAKRSKSESGPNVKLNWRQWQQQQRQQQQQQQQQQQLQQQMALPSMKELQESCKMVLSRSSLPSQLIGS